MFNEQFILLANTVKDATTHGLLQWQKGKGLFSYESAFNNQVLRVDKYFYGDEKLPCVNFSIFNAGKSELISETVRCKDAVVVQEFDFLEGLYHTIELKYTQLQSEQFSPALTALTASLQNKLQEQ
ncbi:hypothetical protein [Asinibacterium sp. OR53]|uniref:hypothetical protein n=1 Tax=Asinibacterium sp. OR53 TaxID=925409 RepID=UPI00047C52F0|nr:hypothetical protein [Asinibacterium sp. OR53]